MAPFSLLIDAQCIFERVEFDVRRLLVGKDDF